MTAALSSGHSPCGLPLRIPDAEDPLALSLNESPFAPLPMVRAAIIRAVDSVNRYPEFLPERFRRLIAKHLGFEDEQIIVGAGATGVVMQVLQALTRPGAEISGAVRKRVNDYTVRGVNAGTDNPVSRFEDER